MRPAHRILTILSLLCVIHPAATGGAQTAARKSGQSATAAGASARDREIAARFAPVFHHGIGDHARGDYLTNFDFDGDWRGDNNWDNADQRQFALRAYVYYAVSETPTHYLVHYAVFHPRDYKGGAAGKLLSGMIREGVRRGGRYDPTGLSEGATLAHENDMEGCLVAVAKSGADLAAARVVAVETVAHDRFLRYAPEGERPAADGRVGLEGQRALLYVEPKGHGVTARYGGGERRRPSDPALLYKFAGRADDPEAAGRAREDEVVGYDLVPLAATLWPRAKSRAKETFGKSCDYGTLAVSVADARGRASSRKVKLGQLGCAFFGKAGAENAARPPWAWFDREERAQTLGAWFFDPAATLKRHYNFGDDVSTAYLHAPFLGVTRR